MTIERLVCHTRTRNQARKACTALAAAVVEGCCLVKKSSAWLVATVHRSRKDIEAGVVPARTAVLGRE